MAQRVPAAPADDAPGPGAYDQSQDLLQSGPAFTLAARPPAFTATNEAPGPGAYHSADGR